MGLKNDATLVGGEAVASGSAGIVTTYRLSTWLTGPTELPWLSARNKD